MPRRGHRPGQAPAGRPRFWGRHAVTAALANPERTVRKVYGTREALASLDLPPVIPITYADVADLGRLVPADAPHQGLVADVDPLEEIWLGDLLDQGAADPEERQRPLVVLDQVTDPHNVGAILRSAAAFDALGIVTQDRHAPPESGALARAASGISTVRATRSAFATRATASNASGSPPRAKYPPAVAMRRSQMPASKRSATGSAPRVVAAGSAGSGPSIAS